MKKVTISVRILNDVSQCLTSVKDSFFLEPSLGSTHFDIQSPLHLPTSAHWLIDRLLKE